MSLSMKKYLVEFGYFGTRFSGVSLDSLKTSKGVINPQNNVGKFIETNLRAALSEICPLFYDYRGASRTDAGVHAFQSTVSVCLDLGKPGKTNPEFRGLKRMNKYFERNDIDICVNSLRHVPWSFHARHDAIRRKYIYRFAVLSKEKSIDVMSRWYVETMLPIAEYNRAILIPQPFDLQLANRVCKALEGTHDFRNLAGNLKHRVTQPDTVRTTEEVKLLPGKPLMDPKYDRSYDGLQFYELHVTSRGFVYNQIRKMMTLILEVASGKAPYSCVSDFLDPTQAKHQHICHHMVEPHGLYLAKIEYPESAFDFARDEKFDEESTPQEELNVYEGNDSIDLNMKETA